MAWHHLSRRTQPKTLCLHLKSTALLHPSNRACNVCFSPKHKPRPDEPYLRVPNCCSLLWNRQGTACSLAARGLAVPRDRLFRHRHRCRRLGGAWSSTRLSCLIREPVHTAETCFSAPILPPLLFCFFFYLFPTASLLIAKPAWPRRSGFSLTQ